MGPFNISFLSFRVIFHFHDYGRKGTSILSLCMVANLCLCPRVRLPGTKSFALPWPQGSRWSECKRYARYAVRPKENALRSFWFSCFLMSLLFYDFCYLKNPKKSAKFAGALARKDDANLLLNRHNSPTDLQSPSVSDCHRSLTPEVWRAWTQTQIPVVET